MGLKVADVNSQTIACDRNRFKDLKPARCQAEIEAERSL